MALAPVAATPLSDQVYRRLLDAILADEFIEGILPSERDLATTFEVNRHAVREALKRLQQARLVEVNQGGSTRVLDYRTEGRLDLLADLLVRAGHVDWKVARSALEMRASIGADAAALCAKRAPKTHKALRKVADAMAAHPEDLPALDADNVVFWTAIVEGSGNLLYRLSLNTLLDGLKILAASLGEDSVYQLGRNEYLEIGELRDVADAIGAGDAERARKAAYEHLRRTVTAAGG
ncbi:MAG TPA: GntR family transcriptional regulator [Mycobacteriales bacterium]|nr:GntR family transcriptional regulator [Mycobacteriales bacterium]